MANELVPQRGITTREEFGGTEVQQSPETAMAAVTARERAVIEAQCLMAERHPRKWLDVRAAMIDHCKRPKFAAVARYARPTGGKELINGEWVDKEAKGFTTRFTEILAQEMGNIKLGASVAFEDDSIRIVRFSVFDLQKNVIKEREVAIAKAVERKGFKNKQGEWQPPSGREVISSRLNSYGDPTYLVVATAEEIRAKVNSEESKTQRDFIWRLTPRDILEDCEERIKKTLADESARDPDAFLKQLLDGFASMRIKPSDLETYMGRPPQNWNKSDLEELIGLGAAIRDNQITFDEAMRARYSPEDGEEETREQHDARLQRQMRQQEKRDNVAEEKIAKLRGQKAESPAQSQPSRVADEPKPAPVAEPAEAQGKQEPPPPTPPPPASDFWKMCNRIEADLGTAEFKRVLGVTGYTSVDEVPPRDQVRVLSELKDAQERDRALFVAGPEEAGPSEGAYREEPPKRGRSGFGGRRS